MVQRRRRLGSPSAIRELLPYTDWIAVSTYPYVRGRALADLDGGYLGAIAALAPEKPFAIAEAGWPAETIAIPGIAEIPSSPEQQRAFLEWLLDQARSLDAEFVTWFLLQDIDQLVGALPAEAQTVALVFRDIGLYDEAGAARPAAKVWLAALATPHSGESALGRP